MEFAGDLPFGGRFGRIFTVLMHLRDDFWDQLPDALEGVFLSSFSSGETGYLSTSTDLLHILRRPGHSIGVVVGIAHKLPFPRVFW